MLTELTSVWIMSANNKFQGHDRTASKTASNHPILLIDLETYSTTKNTYDYITKAFKNLRRKPMMLCDQVLLLLIYLGNQRGKKDNAIHWSLTYSGEKVCFWNHGGLDSCLEMNCTSQGLENTFGQRTVE